MNRSQNSIFKKYQKLVILCIITGISLISIACGHSNPVKLGVYKGSTFWDPTPPGSYDFTLYNLATQSEYVSVPAPCSGAIGEVGHDAEGYGNYLTLLCGNENWLMAHFDSVSVSMGSSVTKGNYVARQGSSGNSTGPHIHAEILGSNGRRIENRAYTGPIIDKYLRYVQS